MNPGAEGDVPVRPSLELELFRMVVRLRIEIPRDQHGHDFFTPHQPDAAKLHVLSDEAQLGELHWGNEPEKFLDAGVGAAPILFQPIAQSRLRKSSRTDPLMRWVVVS
jgi:hypothetical protein